MECEHRWWRARLCASTPFTILTKLSIANQSIQTNKAGIYFNVSVLIGFHMSGFFFWGSQAHFFFSEFPLAIRSLLFPKQEGLHAYTYTHEDVMTPQQEIQGWSPCSLARHGFAACACDTFSDPADFGQTYRCKM